MRWATDRTGQLKHNSSMTTRRESGVFHVQAGRDGDILFWKSTGSRAIKLRAIFWSFYPLLLPFVPPQRLGKTDHLPLSLSPPFSAAFFRLL